MNSATSSRGCPSSAGASPARPPRRWPGLTCGRSPTSWGSRRCAEPRDELRGELSALRAAAEWAAIHWEDDAAREAFAALSVFFFVHGEYEGGETLERIVAALRQGGNTGGKLAGVLAYRVRSAAWLRYDERYEHIARDAR